MTPQRFPDYSPPKPDLEATRSKYADLRQRLDDAANLEAALEVVRDWDALLKSLKEWSAMTNIRFHQDTRDPEAKAAMDTLDETWPKFVDLETKFKRALARSPFRAELAGNLNPQLVALWSNDVKAFDTAIEDDQARESKLGSEYTALIASAEIPFDGETLTLSQLDRHFEDSNRETRKAAQVASSNWFGANAGTLDRIYDEQVKLRDTMARKLGYRDFVELGYLRRQRIGYGKDEVAAFRDEVLREVVPLCSALAGQHAGSLGLDKLMYWDRSVFSLEGNPKPLGGHDWMIERAKEMFRDMGHGLGEFFDEMVAREAMDLQSREGKAGGGFCDFLHKLRFPFIFANFNGTRGDVDVFTHEIGHAFQSYSSRDQPMSDIVWPTTEAAEIHSMALEFLTWPHMNLFYGDEAAEKLRRIHLRASLMFLPYGVSIDAFQHDVYANPDASPGERNAMWRKIESAFLPWYDYGDLEFERSGRLWQKKQHVFNGPFYYIDYTLALTCALQFWNLSRRDPDAALDAYEKICRLGGSISFAEIVAAAGLHSPFEPGCLREVVAEARRYLEAPPPS